MILKVIYQATRLTKGGEYEATRSRLIDNITNFDHFAPLPDDNGIYVKEKSTQTFLNPGSKDDVIVADVERCNPATGGMYYQRLLFHRRWAFLMNDEGQTIERL